MSHTPSPRAPITQCHCSTNCLKQSATQVVKQLCQLSAVYCAGCTCPTRCSTSTTLSYTLYDLSTLPCYSRHIHQHTPVEVTTMNLCNNYTPTPLPNDRTQRLCCNTMVFDVFSCVLFVTDKRPGPQQQHQQTQTADSSGWAGGPTLQGFWRETCSDAGIWLHSYNRVVTQSAVSSVHSHKHHFYAHFSESHTLFFI